MIGFLCHRLHKPRATKSFLGLGTLILVIGGLPLQSYSANRERSLVHAPFQRSTLANPDQPTLIVVLGGGFDPDSWLTPTSRLGSTVTARLVEGGRVHCLLPNSRLLVAFAGDDGTPEEMRATLRELTGILNLDPMRVEALQRTALTCKCFEDFAGEL